jgi:NDP-sugar pyrophosphorylase family protein
MEKKAALRAVIQAGGKGMRLRPYTTIIPKPLMPVDDMPILEVVVRQLAHHGIRRITITTGHLAHLMQAFFGDGRKWGVEIDYVMEPRPLGTVGAVKLVRGLDEPFLMMNGDLLTDIDYSDLFAFHRKRRRPFTVATYRKRVPIDLGVIDLDGDDEVVGFREKPTLEVSVSMGIYVLEPSLLKVIPSRRAFGFDDLMHLSLKKAAPPAIYRFSGRWLDIGRPSDYEVAALELQKHRAAFLPGEKADGKPARRGRA